MTCAQAPSARGIFAAGQSTAGAGLGWDALPGWGLTLHGGQVRVSGPLCCN